MANGYLFANVYGNGLLMFNLLLVNVDVNANAS